MSDPLRLFRYAFALIACVKAVDLAIRLPDRTDLALPLLAAWLVGTALLVTPRWKVGAFIIAAAGSAIVVAGPLFNHHLYLMVLVGVILSMFDDRWHVFLLRAQLTIVYAFAAVTKINGTYLSGDVLARATERSVLLGDVAIPMWLLVIASAGAIIVEGGLAVALWFRHTRLPAAALGIAFHVPLVLATTYGWSGGAQLFVYSAMALALYLPFWVDSDEVVERAVGHLKGRSLPERPRLS
ncbi:HTTM domain-containing protein [Blastococcus sp. SYSU DS0616]